MGEIKTKRKKSLSHIKGCREKKTFFLQCEESDLVESIKRKLNKFYANATENMRLYRGTLLLDDVGDMYSQDIRNGCVLKLCLRKQKKEDSGPATLGEWEVIEELKESKQ